MAGLHNLHVLVLAHALGGVRIVRRVGRIMQETAYAVAQHRQVWRPPCCCDLLGGSFRTNKSPGWLDDTRLSNYNSTALAACCGLLCCSACMEHELGVRLWRPVTQAVGLAQQASTIAVGR